MAVEAIKFYAEWCAPCKVVNNELKDLDIQSYDIEQEPELVRKYQVKTVPTIVFIKDGELVDRLTGVVTKDKYLTKLEELNGN
jgi:thioredoxin 1